MQADSLSSTPTAINLIFPGRAVSYIIISSQRNRLVATAEAAVLLLASLSLDIAQAAAFEGTMYYPEDQLTTILDSVPTFDSAEQEEICQRLVDELSPDDEEIAARSSYAYWYASYDRDDNKECLSATIKRNMAMKEARRHLVGIGGGGNFDKALKSLQGSINYRKEHNIDILRLCFAAGAIFTSDEEGELRDRYQALLEEELPKQLLTVRGRDRENRPILVYMSRQEGNDDFDTEAFVLTRLYVLERATAAVEFLSAGSKEKLTGVFRTGGYQQAHMPPLAAIKTVVTVLQSNYPERLEKLIMLDPPFWMRSLYMILRIFLDEDTANKITMVSGDTERGVKLVEVVSNDQAMPFMLPDGELTSPIDPVYYLHKVPFYCLYDECNLAETTADEEAPTEDEAIFL